MKDKELLKNIYDTFTKNIGIVECTINVYKDLYEDCDPFDLPTYWHINNIDYLIIKNKKSISVTKEGMRTMKFSENDSLSEIELKIRKLEK